MALEKNSFLSLLDFKLENNNFTSFENLLLFIQEKGSKDTTNINDYGYTIRHKIKNRYGGSDEDVNVKELFVTGTSMAEVVLDYTPSWKLEQLKNIFFQTHMDLSVYSKKQSFIVPPDITASMSEKINQITQTPQYSWSRAHVSDLEKRLLLGSVEKKWLALKFFQDMLTLPKSEKGDLEKLKFLILETKKSFLNKPQSDYQEFLEALYKEKSSFFISALTNHNFELLDFLEQEINFDVNQKFHSNPFFFNAQTPEAIAYVVSKEAQFQTCLGDGNKNFSQYWSGQKDGQQVLLELRKLNPSDVDLEEVMYENLKNGKTIAALKQILVKVIKNRKPEVKKNEVTIKGNSIMYQSMALHHWRFSRSIYNDFCTVGNDFEKKLYNELNANKDPVLLHILRETDSGNRYYSDDEGRANFLQKALTYLDLEGMKNHPGFQAKLCLALIRYHFTFLEKEKKSEEFLTILKDKNLTSNTVFKEKLCQDTRYVCNPVQHYYGQTEKDKIPNVEIRSNILSYFVDNLTLSPEEIKKIFQKTFLSPKTKNKPLFESTPDSLLFLMELSERFSNEKDKAEISRLYCSALDTFVSDAKLSWENTAKEYSKPLNTRFSMESYGNAYQASADKILLALCDYNYPFDQKGVESVRKFLDILPVKKDEIKPAIENEVIAYLENQLLKSHVLANSDTPTGQRKNKI